MENLIVLIRASIQAAIATHEPFTLFYEDGKPFFTYTPRGKRWVGYWYDGPNVYTLNHVGRLSHTIIVDGEMLYHWNSENGVIYDARDIIEGEFTVIIAKLN